MKKSRMKLNLRFLLCLLVGGVVFGVCVHFVHGYQVKRNAAALLLRADEAKQDALKAKEEADKARAEKDDAKEAEYRGKEQESLDKEMKYLVRFIGLEPRNIDALARYGEALDDKAKKSENPRARMEAFLRLENVLRLAPERDDIRRRLVESAIYFRRFGDALAHLQVLLNSTPKDAELLQLRGLCKAAKSEFDKAVEDYKKAIEYAPEQIDNYWSLALLYRGDHFKQPEEADKYMEAMVKNGKPKDRAYLTRVQYFLRFDAKDPKKLQQAKDDVVAARQWAPDNPDVVLAQADVERALGSSEAARQTLHKGIELHPRDARLYYALITLEARADNIKEALNLAHQGEKELKDLPDDKGAKSDLLHALADLLVQSGDVEEAQAVIARLKKNPRFPPEFLEYLRARILVREGNWPEAIKLLDDVHPKLSRLPSLEAQALLLLGQSYEQLGNPDQAENAYRKALKLDPLSSAIPYRMGALQLAQGRTEEALKAFSSILTDQKKPADMHLVMVRALIAHNQNLPRGNRNLREIRRELQAAAKENPKAVELPILQAQLILLDDPKKTAEARRIIAQARKERPEEVTFCIAEAQLADPAGADDILEEARKQPKLAGRVELPLARLRLLTQAFAAARTAEQQTKASKRLGAALSQMVEDATKLANETDRSRLLNGLAQAHLILNENAQAERLWNQVAKLQPKNLGVRLLLFDLAFLNKDPEAMDRLLKEMHQMEGNNGVYWRYATALRLIQEAEPENKGELTDAGRRLLGEARQHLVEAATRRPSWPRIATLEAGIDERLGNVNAAIDKYQRALEQGERRPEVIRKTVQLMFEQGKAPDAIKLVRKLLNQGDLLEQAGLTRLAAETLLTNPDSNKSDLDRALQYGLKAVRPDSKQYQDHLWLGRVQWASNSLKDAEKSLQKACELAGNVPETWVTLVAFLAGTGQKDKAEQAIEQAAKKLPADQAPLALAVCYDNLGNFQKAEEQYVAALKAAPEDVRMQRRVAEFFMRHGQLGQAEPILSGILRLKGKQTDDDVMAARRSLAAVLATNPSASNFTKALKLIEENLKINESSLADKHAKAMLLATRHSTRKEAISLFKELGSLPANERFTLVQLYLAEKDWEKAQGEMLVLLASPDGKNPIYEAYFARGLLEHGDIKEAERQLKNLKETLPNSPMTREIEARVLQAKKKDDEAIQVVLQLADGKDADLVRAGILLESLAKESKKRDRSLNAAERNKAQDRYLSAAEEIYRRHVKESTKPERFLTLAAFLANQQKADEALDLCKKAQESKAAPEAVAQTLTNTLRFAKAQQEHGRLVKAWLMDMLAKKPDSVPLMICLADLYDLQEGFDEAEKVYREALRREPENVMVLNNLAWLLAFKESAAQKEALARIQKAISLVGEGPELLDTRGVIYLMLRRTDLAVKDLQEAVSRATTPNHLFHLARALAAANEWRKAGAVLTEAKKLGFDLQLLHPLERHFGKRLLDELAQRVANLDRNP